jgi:hypothetical protein
MLLQTTHQVTKTSGAVHMKSILSVTAFQAMSLMIGSGPNANSKSSLFSPKTGIAFRSTTTRTEIDIQRMGTMERRNQMTMLVILAIIVGTAIVLAALADTHRIAREKAADPIWCRGRL